MAFTGNLTAPHVTPTGQRLWFRGLENLAGTFKSLAKDHALGEATVVITNGASAGGHATWLHADRMTDMIRDANRMANNRPASVVSLPDSGFWPDDPAKRFSAMFRGWFALQGNVTDGLPKHCKYLHTNVTRCLYPEHFADEITTRLFPLQSLYDPDQHMEGKLPAQVSLSPRRISRTMPIRCLLSAVCRPRQSRARYARIAPAPRPAAELEGI